VLEVDRLAARWLVVQAARRSPRTSARGAAGAFAASLACTRGPRGGRRALVGGWFLYAALAFAAIVVQQVGASPSTCCARSCSKNRGAHLALRDGWITVIAPPVGPGRSPQPAVLEARGDVRRGNRAANETLALQPDNAQVRFDLGITYLLAGRFGDALEESRLLTMLDARLAGKLQALARLLSS
jgi:hypothetical protein